MSFLEDLIAEVASQGIYTFFKWLGISIKWIINFGKRPISEIKKDHWNTVIGFSLIIFLPFTYLYFTIC